MSISSREVTYDSYTPSGSSSSGPRPSRISINGVLYHPSSKETLQSHQGSISNSSFHSSTAAIDKDPFVLSGQDPSSSDHKSLHSLLKTTFNFRNQSLSTVCTIRDTESNRGSTATSTPRQSFSFPSVEVPEDEAEFSSHLFFTPLSPLPIFPTPIADSSPSPSSVNAAAPSSPLDDSDSQLSSTMGIMKTPSPTYPPSDLPIFFHAKQITWVLHRAPFAAWSPSKTRRVFSAI
jgi:hypothetical protein